jgi:hypothetical protein
MGACCRQGVGGQAVAWEGIARQGWHAGTPVIFGRVFASRWPMRENPVYTRFAQVEPGAVERGSS